VDLRKVSQGYLKDLCGWDVESEGRL